MSAETTQAPAIRCVKFGRNLINLHNFLFTQTFRTKADNSKGEFGEVFILKFYFVGKTSLELQFDTLEAVQAARESVEKAVGGTMVMPEEPSVHKATAKEVETC